MIAVTRLDVFPIKSLDPVSVSEATIQPGGSLQHDREFALLDPSQRFVNGKRYARIHQIRATFDLGLNIISLQLEDTPEKRSQSFDLDHQQSELAAWLSDYFGFNVTIKQDRHQGFPDDLNASGPTLISTATLETIASWFPDLSLEQIRSRFRMNIEISGVPPFWEDHLFTSPDQPDPVVRFRIGSVEFEGINPCARCIVPTRDPWSGEVYPHFQKQFIAMRQAHVPEWADRSRFDHFYRLGLNTRIPTSEVGKVIRVGDPVEIY